MTLQEISTLQLEDKFYEVLNRMLDFSIIDNYLPAFEFSPDVNLSKYDRLNVNPQLEKPALVDMKIEFENLRAELLAQEQARLDEIARIEALKGRFTLIEADIHSVKSASTKFKDQPNPAIILREIINNDDVLELELMEAEHVVFSQKETLKERNDKLNQLRESRDAKLREVDVMINELSLGIRSDKQAIIDYRQALKDMPNQFIKTNGDPKVAVDSIDLAGYVWPVRPSN